MSSNQIVSLNFPSQDKIIFIREQELTDLQNKLKDKIERIDTLERQLKIKDDEISILRQERDELLLQLALLQKEVIELKNRIKELESESNKYKVEKAEFIKRIEAQDIEINILKLKNTTNELNNDKNKIMIGFADMNRDFKLETRHPECKRIFKQMRNYRTGEAHYIIKTNEYTDSLELQNFKYNQLLLKTKSYKEKGGAGIDDIDTVIKTIEIHIKDIDKNIDEDDKRYAIDWWN